MAKRMIFTIGWQEWALSPQDALILLDIADRAVPVTHSKDYKHKVIESGRDPFVTAFTLGEVSESEPANPAEPEAEAQPPAPLQITEQRKITQEGF